MKLYSENENYKLYQGNMLDMLDVIEKESIDSIVTDPPYGLTSITKRFGKEGSAPASTKNNDGSFARLSKGFMGKQWDGSGVEYNIETWKKCYEVLKPGGYLLAFGGSRTFHRIACAIEDAGFEIRDTIMWIYGSGFPKSMNIGLAIDKKNGVDNRTGNVVKGVGSNNTNSMKNGLGESQEFASEYEERIATNKWQGWGSSLKPSFEPIIVARKPFKGSLVDNVIEYGVGGINIDECRVGNEIITQLQKDMTKYHGNKLGAGHSTHMTGITTQTVGRFPANTILTYDETDFDEVCGGFPICHKAGNKKNMQTKDYSGSASRYFYCAKASKKDRDEGLPNKWLDNLELILYNNIGDELWKDKITIKEENKVKHLEDMAASLQKVIEEYGIQTKKDIDLNTLLYGKKSLEKYLKENKYTTKMGINSTTVSQILNLLTLYTTKENTQDAKLETENGTNHVEIVGNTNQLEIIIKENQELVPGANNVVLKMLLKINEKEGRNEHCTVKPTNLMQYLVRLVTPNGGTVLDPFNGSGSTGKAVMYENKERNKNYKYIGIELTEEYLPIAKARIEYVCNLEPEVNPQMSIFDLGCENENTK